MIYLPHDSHSPTLRFVVPRYVTTPTFWIYPIAGWLLERLIPQVPDLLIDLFPTLRLRYGYICWIYGA